MLLGAPNTLKLCSVLHNSVPDQSSLVTIKCMCQGEPPIRHKDENYALMVEKTTLMAYTKAIWESVPKK